MCERRQTESEIRSNRKEKERKITTGIKKDNCITETKSQRHKKETGTYRQRDMYKRNTDRD